MELEKKPSKFAEKDYFFKLSKFLFEIFKESNFPSEIITFLTSDESLIYFRQGLTHFSSEEYVPHHYEYVGDKIVNFCTLYTMYLKFPEEKNIKYLSEMFEGFQKKKTFVSLFKKYSFNGTTIRDFIIDGAEREEIDKDPQHSGDKMDLTISRSMFGVISFLLRNYLDLLWSQIVSLCFDLFYYFFQTITISSNIEDVINPVSALKLIYTKVTKDKQWEWPYETVQKIEGDYDINLLDNPKKIPGIVGKGHPFSNATVIVVKTIPISKAELEKRKAEISSDSKSEYIVFIYGWPSYGTNTDNPMTRQKKFLIAKATGTSVEEAKSKASKNAMSYLEKYNNVEYSTLETKKKKEIFTKESFSYDQDQHIKMLKTYFSDMLIYLEITEPHIQKLTSQESLKELSQAFIDKSLDSSFNYEYFEFIGDKIINLCIAEYLVTIIPSTKNAVVIENDKILHGKLALAKLASNFKFGNISMEDLLRYGKPIKDILEKYSRSEYIKNDKYRKICSNIVEAFFGGIATILKKNTFNWFSIFDVCYNVLLYYYSNNVVLSSSINAPRTRLQELYRNNKWEFIQKTNSFFVPDSSLNPWNSEILFNKGLQDNTVFLEFFNKRTDEYNVYIYGWPKLKSNPNNPENMKNKTLLVHIQDKNEDDAIEQAALVALNKLKSFGIEEIRKIPKSKKSRSTNLELSSSK